MAQESFNPMKIGFKWVGDWYDWDYHAAHKEALRRRNARAKELKTQGYKVIKTTASNQLVKQGGIGSGHPEIEHFVSVYLVSYYEQEER